MIEDNSELRREVGSDQAAVRAIHVAAFDTEAEADLVDSLREAGRTAVSIVAELDGRVIGHVAFSPVTVADLPDGRTALGLAPVAVLPEHQRCGVGARLCDGGLEVCRAMDVDVVVVLGHPDYYPRFGFVKASEFGLSCEYEVPDDAFMAIELTDGALDMVTGVVRYAPEFGSPGAEA